MTREEAIRCLSVHSSTNGSGLCTDKQHYEAKQMAIKALEQEPCDDAISRRAAIKEVYKMPNYAFATVDVLEIIEQLPSVTPKQRTGHWIERPEIKTSAPEYLMFYECSKCGDKQCFCKPDIHEKHFCINCGARMVEPQESEGSGADSD